MYFIREQRPDKGDERRTPRGKRMEHPTEPHQKGKRTPTRPEFVKLPTGGAIPEPSAKGCDTYFGKGG